MKHKSLSLLCISALCGILSLPAHAADPGTLSVDVANPGPKIGPLFYGLMTEEINHSYDGGLYAELIQNRIFQDDAKPVCWSVVKSEPAAGTIAIDETEPVNKVALTRSLRLDVTEVGAKERVGISNTGFWGIPVLPNTKYHASFYARASEGFTGPLTVDIESNDGLTTFASEKLKSPIGTDWKKYEVDLTTGAVGKSTANRFVISTGAKGSVWFSLVSLFPPTYHDRPNGNRVDLMEKLADMHPAFLRFPGGNFLEGDTIPTRFDWKKTIGPLENRPGHMGCWDYHVSDGLGLLEFLDWCEDLKMEPLLAVYAGYSLKGDHVNPGPDLEPYVQEALEEIEYCTGDASTTWGKRRIADGHPAPFVIHYIEIGNEDWFDKSGSYDGRFTQIFKAIKAKYPQLLCIATDHRVRSCKPDLYDDHDYPHADRMPKMVHRYHHYKAGEPKVFFGEWATQDGKPTPTMRAALCDAAWLTGLQRDCDTVLMNCYAPLLVNVNPGAWQWPTNLIGYDAANSFGSPSYYAQAMFSKAWGDTTLPTKVVAQKVEIPPGPVPTGGVGVATWHTAAEYKDLKVTAGDKVLFASDFSQGVKGWTASAGKWETGDGALKQTDLATTPHLTAGDPDWGDYTLSVKAKKDGGNEGFLIMFHVKDKTHFSWFNVGGWGNSKSSIEVADGGTANTIGDSLPFKVETGKWYDIRVEVKGFDIKCYVDDKLIVSAQDTPVQPAEPLFAAASRVDSTGEVILKVVNVQAAPQKIEIDLTGMPTVAKTAAIEVLQGSPQGQNSVEEPTKYAPQASMIDDAGPKFVHEFPANSVSVIRLKP
jgi:alpha-L-arabinofuranosidase